MRTLFLSILCGVAIFTTTSCHKISGDGPVVSKNIGLAGFNGIYSGIDGDVYFTQDSVYKVEIDGQANILSHIQAYVENGILQMHFEPLANIGAHTRIAVHVSAPAVYNLGVTGPGSLKVLQPLISGSLTLKVNGSGDVYIAQLNGTYLYSNITGSGSINIGNGCIKKEQLQISGSGNIDLLNVIAKTAETNTSGSGTSRVNVSDDLDVSISGSGDVYYTGNPALHSSISGSGKVVHY